MARRGEKQDPVKTSWFSMRQRCNNPNSKYYSYYGGRGISVCERWESFSAFAEDMGPKPSGCSLDRKNVNGNYEPENCRWATSKEQMRNRRNTVFIVLDGVTYKLSELVELSGLKPDTIKDRAIRGMTYGQVIAKSKYINVSGLALGGAISSKRRQEKTHCKRGHEFTPENIYMQKRNGKQARSCRKCHAEKTARQRKSALLK
jgi:hypothetical protein